MQEKSENNIFRCWRRRRTWRWTWCRSWQQWGPRRWKPWWWQQWGPRCWGPRRWRPWRRRWRCWRWGPWQRWFWSLGWIKKSMKIYEYLQLIHIHIQKPISPHTLENKNKIFKLQALSILIHSILRQDLKIVKDQRIAIFENLKNNRHSLKSYKLGNIENVSKKVF